MVFKNYQMTKEEFKEIVKKRFPLWQESVYKFAIDFFPHLLFKKVPDFHKEIYKELPNHPLIAIEAFRGAAKSTIGLIIYPIWFALFKRIGDISLISLSEEFILNEVTRKIKWEFENNKFILAVFGDLSTQKWAESYFVLKNGIAFEGGGISGQLRGGRRGLIALDDLENEETVQSEEQRDKLRKRISKELMPKLLSEGQIIYHGTPIHVLCYLRQIMGMSGNGWFKLRFPCYKNGIEKEGNEAWSDMFPHKRLQTMKKAMGSNAFVTEMMCNPLMEENLPIKESYLRYWTELPHQYSCAIAVDPAYSTDETSDYKVASVIAIDQHNNRYLLDYIRTHEETGKFIDSIINLYIRYKGYCNAVGIPSGGADTEFFNSFMKRLEERRVFEIPVQELKNTYTTTTDDKKRNKKSRITAALQPLFEQGKYYIHSSHMEAREELLTIGQSKWDDIVDTLAYAEQILQPVYYDAGLNSYYPDEEPIMSRGDSGYGDGL